MGTRASGKNEKQYEALKDKGMSKERAAKIANSPNSSSNGGEKSGSGGNLSQGGTTAQKKRRAGRAARPRPRSPEVGAARPLRPGAVEAGGGEPVPAQHL